MSNKLMLGVWRFMIGVPPFLWEKQIKGMQRKLRRAMASMDNEQRRVHLHVVTELPRRARSLTPVAIAEDLALQVERVEAILSELERRMTFLVTDDAGAVIWAYPVTVERTPHAIAFPGGERLWAA